MPHITVVPAYGRDYKNAPSAKADWAAGLDFIETFSGKYINKPQADEAGMSVTIRYANHRRVTSAA